MKSISPLQGPLNALLIAFLFAITGCVSSTSLSTENSKKIKAIYLDANVSKAPEMYYLGPDSAVGLANLSALEPGEALKKYAEDNNIFVDIIAREELLAAFGKNTEFQFVDNPANANAVIKTTVYLYGFSVQYYFSSTVVPMLGIRCEMFDENNNLIWQAEDSLTTLSFAAEPISIDEMKADPGVISESWRLGSREIAENIAARL